MLMQIQAVTLSDEVIMWQITQSCLVTVKIDFDQSGPLEPEAAVFCIKAPSRQFFPFLIFLFDLLFQMNSNYPFITLLWRRQRGLSHYVLGLCVRLSVLFFFSSYVSEI